MSLIKLQQDVDVEGVLSLQLSLGQHLAGSQVEVAIDTTPALKDMDADGWKTALLATAGSWQGTFEQFEHLPLDERTPL